MCRWPSGSVGQLMNEYGWLGNESVLFIPMWTVFFCCFYSSFFFSLSRWSCIRVDTNLVPVTEQREFIRMYILQYRLRILDFFSFIQFLGSAGFVVNERVASFVYTPKFLVRWQQIFTGDCTNAHHPSLFLHTRCNIHVIIREKYCLTG